MMYLNFRPNTSMETSKLTSGYALVHLHLNIEYSMMALAW